ncbi:hypothetical protein C8J56DRAFT_1059304 [Mycena floridula]|nr:hypothetical protein C8J56DRAFT_1059304 [Mycena floridula]
MAVPQVITVSRTTVGGTTTTVSTTKASSTTTTSSTKTTTTATSTSKTTSSPPTSTPPATKPPPAFNITSLGVNGSGCPPGSAFYLLNNDHTAVTITFSELDASAGPGVPLTEARKNCIASLNVHVPQGFSMGIVDVDYRGFYMLDTGVNALHDAVYYFQGQVVQSEATSTLKGPVEGEGADYIYRDEFNLTPTIYSPCGEDTVLNINTEVRIDNSANPKGSGFITDDSIDAGITQTFNFQWLTC